MVQGKKTVDFCRQSSNKERNDEYLAGDACRLRYAEMRALV
jgi:hypothetical protein